MHALPKLGGISHNVSYFETPDGRRLRYGEFYAGHSPRGTITIAPGMRETLLGSQRFASALARTGWCVFVLEPQGQGGSSRLSRNFLATHAVDFAVHRHDFRDFMHQVVAPHAVYGKPNLLLAHSQMGGVSIPAIAYGMFPVDGFVAMAPMVEAIKLPTTGPAAKTIRAAARLMTRLGFGKSFAPGGGRFDLEKMIAPDNDMSPNIAQLRKLLPDWGPSSKVATWGPTWSWVGAYYQNVDRINAIPSQSIDLPTLFILADDDRVLKNEAVQSVAAEKFTNYRIETIHDRHCIHYGFPETIANLVRLTNEFSATLPARNVMYRAMPAKPLCPRLPDAAMLASILNRGEAEPTVYSLM